MSVTSVTVDDLYEELEDEEGDQPVVAELDGVRVPIKGVRYDRDQNVVILELSPGD